MQNCIYKRANAPCFIENGSDALADDNACIGCGLLNTTLTEISRRTDMKISITPEEKAAAVVRAAIANIEPSDVELKCEAVEPVLSEMDLTATAKEHYGHELQQAQHPNYGAVEAKAGRIVTPDNYIALALLTEAQDFDAIRERLHEADVLAALKGAFNMSEITGRTFDRLKRCVFYATKNEDYPEVGNIDLGVARDALNNVFVIRILHAIMGLVTESAEMVENMQNFVFGPGPRELSVTNLEEEAGDLFWYLALLADAMGRDNFNRIMQTNIDKLEERYAGKFSEYDATNRNLEKERAIIEGVANRTSVEYSKALEGPIPETIEVSHVELDIGNAVHWLAQIANPSVIEQLKSGNGRITDYRNADITEQVLAWLMNLTEDKTNG